jgi:cytidylate kinase
LKKINIAIDGWSACGKGTLAKSLAKELNYIFIDSGAMYRAFTLAALRNKIEPSDTNAIKKLTEVTNIHFETNDNTGEYEIWLNNEMVETQIRDTEVASKVSHYAQLSPVRQFLVSQQQEIGKNKGVVMDGRDIGTVVFPNAELKIFMTAEPEIRAQRRYQEFKQKGKDVSLEEIAANLTERDFIDSNRSDSPLVQAEDARILDNSNLTIPQQLQIALDWAKNILH